MVVRGGARERQKVSIHTHPQFQSDIHDHTLSDYGHRLACLDWAYMRILLQASAAYWVETVMMMESPTPMTTMTASLMMMRMVEVGAGYTGQIMLSMHTGVQYVYWLHIAKEFLWKVEPKWRFHIQCSSKVVIDALLEVTKRSCSIIIMLQ